MTKNELIDKAAVAVMAAENNADREAARMKVKMAMTMAKAELHRATGLSLGVINPNPRPRDIKAQRLAAHAVAAVRKLQDLVDAHPAYAAAITAIYNQHRRAMDGHYFNLASIK